MPHVEQLLLGGDHRRDPAARGVLGASAGLGVDVTAEIERLCRGWGDPPPFGLRHPALMSFPLAATMPAIRGRLYAVIRVGDGAEPLFHACVVGDALYATFDRNPFRLARHLALPDRWQPGAPLPRLEIGADPHEVPAELVPGPGDRGFIDEAVVQLILAGRLLLPLEQAGADSDRALALMITCLPAKVRRDLRFASLATSEANGYTLGAVATTGAAFAGWQRLLLATPSSGITPDLAAYQAALAQHLAAGDLNAIARLALRHEFGTARDVDAIATAVTERRPAVTPRPLESPLAAVITPLGRGGLDAGPPPARPGSDDRRAGPAFPGARTAALMGPAAYEPPAPRRATGRPRGETVRGLPDPRRPVSRRSGLVRVLAVVLVLFLAGAVGTLWLNGRTLTQSLEWAGVPGLSGGREETARGDAGRVTTLLEVVDVGRVYEEQRAVLAGAGGRLGPSVDQARRRALANLSARGAAPLLAQIDLFAKLSADGIQQGSRPDREAERLRALARQGEVLGSELKRLELCWYALAAGTLWHDLRSLPDEAVAARSDSLTLRDRTALDEARIGLGLPRKIKDLAEARRNVAGMASLVELFQAPAWSPRWAADLKAAADLVSPAASPLTRAYRNCAFQLLRVKEAERAPGNRGLPYVADLAAPAWPSPAIRALLPDLRRAAGAFGLDDAPTLVAGTLKLYSDLGDPVRAVAAAAADAGFLARLEANPAFRFDAAAYRPFLDRLRYEAATRPGAAGDARSRDAVRFSRAAADGRTARQWEALADSLRTPFLAEWARRRAGAGVVAVDQRRAMRAVRLQEARVAAGELRRAAAEGRDWSAEWRRTSALVSGFLGDAAVAGDAADGTAEMAELAAALDRPLPLRLEGATVRLAPAALAQPEVAVLEIRAAAGDGFSQSRAFTIGPVAEPGSGWEGQVDLEVMVPLGPRDALHCRVVAADGRQLLELTAPSLADGDGPGAFGRLRPADGGSVRLQAGPGWWTALALPAPPVAF